VRRTPSPERRQGVAALAVPALGLGFAGWKLGGYRLALLFLGSIVLLAAALYWYADRIAMGMVGARELLPARRPALHSRSRRCPGARAVIRRALPARPTATRARSSPARRGRRLALAVSVGLARCRDARRARGDRRARARAPAPPRRPRADARP
jgi:hypothetical protein